MKLTTIFRWEKADASARKRRYFWKKRTRRTRNKAVARRTRRMGASRIDSQAKQSRTER
jgi:hypothetical protein